MGRQRSPVRDNAYELFKKASGKIALKEIADALGVPEGTVRGWKNKDDWDSKLFGTLRKNTERSKNRKVNKKLLQSVEKNEELTEMEKLFCFWYARTNNATAATVKAGFSDKYPNRYGWMLLQKEKIRAEIKRLRSIRNEGLLAGPTDVVEKMMEIAFADITAFVEFSRVEVPVMTMFGPMEIKNEETGEKEVVMKEINEVRFKDSETVDGSLLSEVRQGKDGASVKLADRMKALLWLADYFELNPKDRHKIEFDRRKMEIELLKVEAQLPDKESDAELNDGFLEALNAQAGDVWADGDDHVME